MTPSDEGKRAARRIVVGVDASGHSHEAVRWAISFAQPGDTIELVHAWNLHAIAALAAPDLDPTAFETAANRLLSDTADEVFEDEDRHRFDVVLTAIQGHAAGSLIDRSEGADLLVVGRRGLGGFRSLLLGSVSSDVIQHATCPVVVNR